MLGLNLGLTGVPTLESEQPYSPPNTYLFDGSGPTPYLKYTPSVDQVNARWTVSMFIKPVTVSVSRSLFNVNIGASDWCIIGISSDNNLYLKQIYGNATAFNIRVPAPTSTEDTFHLHVIYDSGNATQTDRIRFYVNMVRQTNYQTGTGYPDWPDLWEGSWINLARPMYIGCLYNPSQFAQSYLSDIHYMQGLAVPVDSVVKDVGGQIRTRPYTGGYGTNGFHLDFADPENLGNDVSGNNNNAYWQP